MQTMLDNEDLPVSVRARIQATYPVLQPFPALALPSTAPSTLRQVTSLRTSDYTHQITRIRSLRTSDYTESLIHTHYNQISK